MQADLLRIDLKEAVSNHDPTRRHRAYYRALNGNAASDHLNRLMYVDFKTLLVDGYMEKLDKATMACGLEARVPLLDHRLVEIAFQIPAQLKICGGASKRILKKAVQDLLPGSVLRKPKHGFAVPLDPWFRGELKNFSFEVLMDNRTRQRGYFNPAFVERLWREHLAGREILDAHLWVLLNFELWHRIYLENEAI
jgi:asparagine synthase (glutamine-hydrolysing)